MKTQFDKQWKEWIHLNIERGCDKDGIVKILLEHDFHPQTILDEMQYSPVSIEVRRLTNLKINTQASVTLSTPSTQSTTLSTLSTLSLEQNTANSFTALDALYLPFAKKIETDKVSLYLVDTFLTPEECDETVIRIQRQCRPSTITTIDEPDHTFRTSQTCDLSIDPDEFINDIDHRIADYMGFETQRSEGIQGQFYQVGNQFKTHTDYFEPGTHEFQEYASEMGQRTWTFMVYLNDVPKGGQTQFTKLGLTLTPKKGQAVIWNNLHKDGTVNKNTLHWAKPILQGEKYIITKWFRTHGSLKHLFVPFIHKQIPAFTQEGFTKATFPATIYQKIIDFYQQNRINAANEDNTSIGTFIHAKSTTTPSKMIELTSELREDIFQIIHPMLEEWSGQQLVQTAVYGIREYQQGASLDMHVDRYQTHIISVIINVDQEINQEWPLIIYDHYSRAHKVLLKPGDCVFYESAKLAHGRPEPLEGKRYANIFAHTMPVEWAATEERITQLSENGEATASSPDMRLFSNQMR